MKAVLCKQFGPPESLVIEDVPSPEPQKGQVLLDDELTRLLTFPNVLVTSHQAFLTHEALSEIARVTTENISRFEKGEPFLEGTRVEAK